MTLGSKIPNLTCLALHTAKLQPCFIPTSQAVNLAQRSFKVINFGGNRKLVHDFMQGVSSNFRCIFSRFRHIAATQLSISWPGVLNLKISCRRVDRLVSPSWLSASWFVADLTVAEMACRRDNRTPPEKVDLGHLGGSKLHDLLSGQWTKVHRTYFAERDSNRSRSHVFPILDILSRSGDIRDQSRKLCTIDPNFACFGPKFFRGGPQIFWTCIIKFSQILITWQSFTAIGQRSSEILLRNEKK